jgi:methionyl-tRNA formyltransferase
MKIVFAGSPEYAVPSLKALIDNGFNVIAVVTQPDKPLGRKQILTPTPVKAFAESAGIPVYDFAKIGDHEAEVKALGADIMITCAYGQILTRGILNSFPSGIWNLHASLLPKFRGASPIQSAILAGERYTGVTVMRTEQKLDCGDILLVKRCEIGKQTAGELSEMLSAISAECAVEAVKLLESGDVNLILQDEAQATYCKKINKADGKIDFSKPCAEVVRLVKAFSPSPAAFCNLDGGIVNIYDAEEAGCDAEVENGVVVSADRKSGILVKCATGGIKILSAQLQGGKRLSYTDLINGRKIKEGDRLD